MHQLPRYCLEKWHRDEWWHELLIAPISCPCLLYPSSSSYTVLMIKDMRLTRLKIGTYLSAELVEFVRSDAALISLGSPLGDVRDLAVRKAAVSHESSGPYEN